MRKLTQIINEKQSLIVGVTKTLGEFVSVIRNVRRGIDSIKAGEADEQIVNTVDSSIIGI
jgi:hypothetical protein